MRNGPLGRRRDGRGSKASGCWTTNTSRSMSQSIAPCLGEAWIASLWVRITAILAHHATVMRHAVSIAKAFYRCGDCGAESPKWAGQRPDCGEWNTLV